MSNDWDEPYTIGDAERKRVYTNADGKTSVLFDLGDEEVWVPEKCIHEDSDIWGKSKESSGTLVVRLWWADKNRRA